MVKLPPYLKRGDTIGLVAPAGFMPFEKMQTCIDILGEWGYQVKLGDTAYSQSENYFSGTDEQRLRDVQQMMDDPQVKAILCARGGYGVSRIIDQLSFKKFRKHPKWLIGFSDITVFHSHIYTNYKIPTLHAPMAAAFNEGEYNNPYVQSLKAALAGQLASYECAAHDFNQQGEAEGILVGGNLAMLAHMVGTQSDIKAKNKILFLEDVGEYLYNIDRMFIQLKRSGKLDKLAGLIIGGFTDSKDTDRPFGKSVYEILQEHLKDYKYPICFGFPISHDKENYALKVGVEYTLKVAGDGVRLTEKETNE
ncbi:S66 peptidase family protein [Flavisolibacter tropicus]|uniref:Peptidase S66 n=1 Tax=Flavisolibacter tropicus TaxID=1492898 RepID=A0A172TUH4_9BACT|nr:LD-carboxypeptidase [Flavisolibacter tropicus]ANE50534.1 peptidase S66 [Flavisolibacter tropicus]